LALHPIQSFESSFEFVDMLDRAVRPFGFYLPMFAVFENYTKYRISRRHVFTHPHMMAPAAVAQHGRPYRARHKQTEEDPKRG
jgi:hypothetical protein